MSDKYQEFTDRLIQSFANNMRHIPKEWTISERLSEKITMDGELKPFYGSTSVIALSEQDGAKCRAIQNELFARHADMFVKLHPETFHLTIHAFSNPYSVSTDNDEIKRDMAAIEGSIRAEFRKISEVYKGRTIRMKALGVSTGGGDVISIKFCPAAVRDYQIISDLFDRFERLYPLNKPYIPHVSLGYFKLKKYDSNEIESLYDTLIHLNQGAGFEIELEVNRFAYQHHYHMNDFRDVFRVDSVEV